jgi:immunoglobulin-binding protein 1
MLQVTVSQIMDEKDDWTDDEELDQELLNLRHIKVQDVPFDPVAFAAQSLRKQFIEAQKLFLQSADGKEKSAAKSALERFKVVQKGISQAAVFSTNESIEEIATGDLKYLLVQSYLSKLYLSASESTPDARMKAIKESLSAAYEFLILCEALEILAPHDRLLWKQLKKDLKNLDSENPSSKDGNENLNAMQMREIKITQFRQRKENQERLSAIQAKMEKLRNDNSKDPDEIDDEMERDYFIITIDEAVRETLSDISLSLSELDLLKQRQQLLEKNPMADQNVPLSVNFLLEIPCN